MYVVRDNPPQDVQRALDTYDTLTQRLLYTRGITTAKEAALFLEKAWEETDPYMYAGMRQAADRVLGAVVAGETIGIYSDYDCDGIPAAAALYTALKALGHNRIVYYVPNRNEDGFGLNTTGIQHLQKNNVTVACVLDCGTADPDGISQLQDAGIEVIVIDHHLPGNRVPKPLVMINPLLESGIPEPFPCAAGITYLFVQALVRQAQETALADKVKPGWEKWQLDVVSLATVSDMVPLKGINRRMVHHGLTVLRKSPRPGIRALCADLQLKQSRLTQEDITFLIVPRINAASRMGDARLAFTLLTTESMDEACACAAALTTLNNKRKSTVATMVREAHKQAAAKRSDRAVWVFGKRTWKPSLVGLVAQRMAETYNKTVFVWGLSGGISPKVKGSCRSTSHNIFELMQSVPDLFIESGGHAQAGGFTLKDSAEVTMEDCLNVSETLNHPRTARRYVDGECRISDISDVVKLCNQFAPFGKDNEQVHIAIPNCIMRRQMRFGKNKEHIRYVFEDETGSLDGITFFADESLTAGVPERQKLQAVTGVVEMDAFRNRPRVRVTHILR